MRLYPVPFRFVDDAHKFQKYAVVEVAVRDAGSDKRAESLKVDAESLQVQPGPRGWRARSAWVEPMAGRSMCDVMRRVGRDRNSISLAAVRPRSVSPLRFAPHLGWTEVELARLRAFADRGDLFNSPESIQRRRSFMVLGVYYPRAGDVAPDVLF